MKADEKTVDLESFLEAAQQCAAACRLCADACLNEEGISMLTHCIRLDIDCAAICTAAASLVAGRSIFAPQMCRLCAEVCEACAGECDKHTHDHCKKCAEACRRCAEACRSMSDSRHNVY